MTVPAIGDSAAMQYQPLKFPSELPKTVSLANFRTETIDLVHLNFSENQLFRTGTINLLEHSSGVV